MSIMVNFLRRTTILVKFQFGMVNFLRRAILVNLELPRTLSKYELANLNIKNQIPIYTTLTL